MTNFKKLHLMLLFDKNVICRQFFSIRKESGFTSTQNPQNPLEFHISKVRISTNLAVTEIDSHLF